MDDPNPRRKQKPRLAAAQARLAEVCEIIDAKLAAEARLPDGLPVEWAALTADKELVKVAEAVVQLLTEEQPSSLNFIKFH